MSILSPDSAQYYYDKILAIDAAEGPKKTDKFKDLRAVLDSLFKELTSQESQYFKSTFSRSNYIFDKYDVSPVVRDEVHGLRVRANHVVHNAGADVSDDDLLTGMKALALAISHFGNTPEPVELSTKYSNRPELTFKQKQKRNHTHVSEMQLTVVEVLHEEATSFRTTLRGDAEELGDIIINLFNPKEQKDFWRSCFAEVGKRLSKYAHVSFYNIQLNEGTENVYSTTPHTIMVVEPDYLIEASKLAECFDRNGINPNIYLLGKFKQSETSYKMMLGNVANNILDTLALSPGSVHKDVRHEPMGEQAFGLLCVAQQGGKFVPGILNDMYQDAAPHVAVINEVLARYKHHKLLIEPTYFSTRFGLHGRLDMLAQDPAEDRRKNIVELKSGSVPGLNYNDGLWQNNKAQIQCYNMLLESTFPGRSGDSAILYSNGSKNDGKPLRNHAESVQLRQELMTLRNLIVLNDFLLAECPEKVLGRFNPEKFGARAQFDEEALQGIWNGMRNSAPHELKYFRDFVGFVAREQRTAKIGSDEVEGTPGFAALWRSARADKRSTFSILDYLRFSRLTESSEVHLTRDLLSDKMSNLREGDITILYPFVEGDELAAVKNQILKCNIKRITDTEVVVALRSKTMDADYFKKHPYWALERDLMEKGFDDMYKSLACFLQTPKPKRDLLFGLKAPVFESLKYKVSGELSDEQRELMERALGAKDYFLLQGPPGTGKTSYMLRNMVQSLHDSTDENIMVMAFTNSAVEEICRHLDKAGLPHLRLSRSGSAANCFNKLAEEKTVSELNESVVNTRIFVSTQASLGGFSQLAKFKKFHTVIVDEASQLLEPHLVGILPLFERFILIGDEKQLPAVVTQADKYTKVEDEVLLALHLKSLKNSLFSRLQATCQANGWHQAYGMLTRQGRMHHDICAYVSSEYYGNKLQPIREDQFEEQHTFKIDSENKYERALAKSRLIFVPAAREAVSKVSQGEAAIVAGFIKTVHKVYGSSFTQHSVGVVTPYRSQIATIKRSGHVEPAIMQQVDVDTVERFQGSERDVIIISLAVNHHKQMQFLESLTDDGMVDRKLNVSLTRAKKQVVLVGCESVLRSSASYRKLLEYISDKGGYINLSQI
ncbi:DEAD/DEAH box helicase [Pontibacter chinhatensis]|uniref:DNA replication ATP-dependent helicase Dna2 n=1 Tax=Pontibacter chinhatensis TaxID=1436961 RepID=A0A1I2QNV2_9BACT|nr:DEAD/DEAH box helicase [Pontibacter chinhatensis]SFG28989.1 DNA replication ATP-dependent helicase Dna2 [Pontibacter chinhatensis]